MRGVALEAFVFDQDFDLRCSGLGHVLQECLPTEIIPKTLRQQVLQRVREGRPELHPFREAERLRSGTLLLYILDEADCSELTPAVAEAEKAFGALANRLGCHNGKVFQDRVNGVGGSVAEGAEEVAAVLGEGGGVVECVGDEAFWGLGD